jgi:hypothetical protein
MSSKQRDEAPTSYLAFAEISEPLPQGRYANVEPRHVVGRAPVEDVPRHPADSPWHADPVGPEPPLGIEIDAPIDIGWPTPPQSFAPCSKADGEQPAAPAGNTSPTVRARAAKFHERRRLP